MGFPLVQFVTKPEPGATVLYDFNVDTDSEVGHDGFSLGAPEWTGAPDATGGRDGYRTVEFVHLVESSASDAVGELTELARLLAAPSQWLLVQLSTFAHPRWIKTWRSDAAELSWESVMLRSDDEPHGQFGVNISLTADPWLLGERESLPLGSVSLDPAVGVFKALPDIEGDAPAPASVRLVWDRNDRRGRRDMVSLGPVRPDQTAAYVSQLDTWDAGTDTSGPVADALFSGGSYMETDFSTQAGLARRLSTGFLFVRPGRYKVMLRLARSDSFSQFAARLGMAIGVDAHNGERVVAEWDKFTGAHAAWLDLGDFWMPAGMPAGLDPDAEEGMYLAAGIDVERIDGAGSARLDCLLLIPINDDTRTLFRSMSSWGISAGDTVEIHDADVEAVYARNLAVGNLQNMKPPQLAGGFARVYPGRPNGLHILGQSHPTWAKIGTNHSDEIAETVDVTVTYQPRYMWPDPAN